MDPGPSRPGSPEAPAGKAVEPDMTDAARGGSVRGQGFCGDRHSRPRLGQAEGNRGRHPPAIEDWVRESNQPREDAAKEADKAEPDKLYRVDPTRRGRSDHR